MAAAPKLPSELVPFVKHSDKWQQLLQTLGSSDKLDLSGRNLEGIDPSGLRLRGINLRSANLRSANLNDTDLTQANLRDADLREADLSQANLLEADVSNAKLDSRYSIAAMGPVISSIVSGMSGSPVMIPGGLIAGVLGTFSSEKSTFLRAFLDEYAKAEDQGVTEKRILAETNTLRIRIIEDPLSAQNLALIISTLTELTTKYWLIAQRRFADLIEYTQTHNGRFAEEAQIVITRISYNSPFNMDWKVDLSAPSVAEALVTTIDGITQRLERLEKAQLENQAKVQEIREAEQKTELEKQMALLEQEKQRLELEQRRLEVLEKQLEVQKKGIEYALEIASKVVDTLHPGADSATRAMEIQALLPNLIQLQNGKGLELALPPPPKSDE
ncbi:MAG TPA: pentapeptide repeat-containing protein [Ktedonobacteraceae bacterium]